MKRYKWQIILGMTLLGLSGILYFTHFMLFHDAHHIFIYLIGDIAFVPVEVLLVTLIIERLLHYRAKKAKMAKLNMVIGTFFSEVGSALLRNFAAHDPDAEELIEQLDVESDWTMREFDAGVRNISRHKYGTTIKGADLQELRAYLLSKRGFLLRLLGNPNLLEHDAFTDCLWAVFHLTEELNHRESILELSDTDYKHLCGDIHRAYSRVAGQWIAYMRHLKAAYPYLFSLAMRTNPFNPEAAVEVKS